VTQTQSASVAKVKTLPAASRRWPVWPHCRAQTIG